MKSRVDVAEATIMREQGMTLEEIGQRFGVTRERIRQLVGKAGVGLPADCGHCGERFVKPTAVQRYCSTRCSNAASRARHPQSICPLCGGLKSIAAVSCRACSEPCVQRRAGDAVIIELWNRGESVSTIATALDTTVNALGVRICRMRREGLPLPYRRRVFHGDGSPTFPDQEIHEFRPAHVSVLDVNTKEILSRTKRRAKHRYAHQILYRAIDRGEVVRADKCERCGGGEYVEGHHADYSEPLEVEWLCFPCHRQHHVGERQAAA